MDTQTIKNLIRKSPALSENKKAEWITRSEDLGDARREKLAAIFGDETGRNEAIAFANKANLQKRAQKYKAFLDDFQHRELPKIMKEVESGCQKKDEEQAEDLLDGL